MKKDLSIIKNDSVSITIIHPSMHSIGGAERLAIDLALGLADENTRIELITGICNKIWREQISKNADTVLLKEVGRPAPGSIRFWINVDVFVKGLIKLIKPKTDAIFTSAFPSSLVATKIPKNYNVKIIHYFQEAPIVLHDYEGQKESPVMLRVFYKFISKIYEKSDLESVKESDLILANSYLTRRINARIYDIEQSKIKVVYPGVNIKHIKRSSRILRSLSKFIQKGIPIIFFPKGTKFWWNQETCLQALKEVRIGRFLSIFTGGTSYEAKTLIKQARKLKIRDKILWIQKLSNEEMNSIYSQSSIVVSIPKRQPFGLIPLESLVCETPPIISSSSGVCEVLRNRIDVICVDGSNPYDLAEAIEGLILDSDLRRMITSNGKRKVQERFTSARFIKEIKEHISEIG